MEYLPQQLAPRYDIKEGVDYSADGRILAIKGELMLVWQPGSSAWNGMHGTSYHPASLMVRGIPGQRVGTTLHEGGRLSRKLIHKCEAAIDKHFGPGTAALIDLRRTLVLDQ